MSPHPARFTHFRHLLFCVFVCIAGIARAQNAPPPAYIATIEGPATIERDGELHPAVVNLPLVPGDRLRTTTGRVEIVFPDGSGIEVGQYSEIEMLSPTRVRLIAGTMDHLQSAAPAAVAVSTAYLPQDLQMYSGTLDRNGSWGYDAPYGYVWYPTVVSDWRPYYYGSWSAVPTYGWTWVGLDTWSWPTHHYGRWGYSRSRWFWIPGRTWGPAWVSWAAAPGYVSWCPLGFDSRPVFALSIGYSGWWNGWTVLPRGNFGAHGYYAHRNAVDPRRFTRDTPFIVQNTPPVPVLTARRNADAAPTAAGIAVPRGVDSRESGVGSRGSVVGSRPLSADTRTTNDFRRIPNAEPRTTNTDPRTANEQRPTTNDPRPFAVPRNPAPDYRPPTPDYRVPTRDSNAPRRDDTVIVPRATMPPPDYRIQRGEPRTMTPDYRPPANDARPPATNYRPPTPDYRPPTTDYRVPRAVPRAEAPPERAAPPPPAASQPARSAPAQQSAAPGGARERSGGAPREGAPSRGAQESGARERSGGEAQAAGTRRPR